MEITVHAPGRVVFFGEHQDYLGCPVIPAAIDKKIVVTGSIIPDDYEISLTDMNELESFSSRVITYVKPRDYLRSGVKVLQEEGVISEDKGVRAVIYGTIPIQAGLSSSSALCVAWITFLSTLHEQSLTPMEITRLAHRAEVLEFNEPGGMQDHMASAFGYINYEEFTPVRCTRLAKDFPGIVVGNSLERKPTLDTLSRIKSRVKRALDRLGLEKLADMSKDDLEQTGIYKHDPEGMKYLRASVMNREITEQAHKELRKSSPNPVVIGQLMDKHHSYLRDDLSISTPIIEKMIQQARRTGALGCKITGSGNGGCMIAYCPGREKEVIRAIRSLGVEAFNVSISPGASVISNDGR
ncbi:MAG: galactokinase family protein [Candidatus Odinarchaeota archaeon]